MAKPATTGLINSEKLCLGLVNNLIIFNVRHVIAYKSAIPDNMSKYYPSEYYSLAKGFRWRIILENYFLYRRDLFAFFGKGNIGKAVYFFFPDQALTHIRNLLLPGDSRILDVGSGQGRHLRVLANLGFTKILGIDPFIAKDMNITKNIKILKRSIDRVEGEFDLILLNHSLEHIEDQPAVFSSISRLLAPRGVALVRIPTVSSQAWERYGIYWAGLDAPRHIYLHSITSLEILLSRAGLRSKRMLFDSTVFQFWASEQNQNWDTTYVQEVAIKAAA